MERPETCPSLCLSVVTLRGLTSSVPSPEPFGTRPEWGGAPSSCQWPPGLLLGAFVFSLSPPRPKSGPSASSGMGSVASWDHLDMMVCELHPTSSRGERWSVGRKCGSPEAPRDESDSSQPLRASVSHLHRPGFLCPCLGGVCQVVTWTPAPGCSGPALAQAPAEVAGEPAVSQPLVGWD